MTRADVIAAIAANAETLRGLGVRTLELFGSFARDEAGPESDVGLLIELPAWLLWTFTPTRIRSTMIPMPTLSRELAAAQRVVARHDGVRLALAFGSVARGMQREESDIDVAIDATGEIDALTLARELSIATGREAHVIALREVDVPLLDELVRDGVVLHEARAGLAAEWRSRALCTLEIDRPWYARMNDAWLRRVAAQGLPRGQS